MKIDTKSLDFTNCSVGNKPPPIPFYVPDSDKKLSSLDYHTYKLRTNPKDEKLAVYNLSGYSLWKLLCRLSRVKTSKIEMWRTL
eukprot:1026225-Ditylum_brightwellii.AAC.1